jgi:hypothetical protein
MSEYMGATSNACWEYIIGEQQFNNSDSTHGAHIVGRCIHHIVKEIPTRKYGGFSSASHQKLDYEL